MDGGAVTRYHRVEAMLMKESERNGLTGEPFWEYKLLQRLNPYRNTRV